MSSQDNNIENFLFNLSPDFKDLIGLLKIDEKKNRIIKGFMQSRKTWIIIAMSIYYILVLKLPVFLVIENKVDALHQMIRRIKKIFTEYTKNNLEVLDIKRGRELDIYGLLSFQSHPKIYICLRNETDLSPINISLMDLPEKKYVVIIDESDALDNNRDSQSQRELDHLTNESVIVWNVTATALTTLMKQEIEASNVFIMKKPDKYKDLSDFKMVQIKKAIACNSALDDPFEKIPCLEKYIKKFSEKNPYQLDKIQKHPVISLIKIGSTVNPQNKIFEFISTTYPGIICITYNGVGLTICGDNLPTYVFDCAGVLSFYNNNVHTFSKCQVGDILTYLYENGGSLKFPRIIIISGVMAGRGITFCSSNYNKCLQHNLFPWHLTEMFYITAQNTCQPDLLQSAGRLCGVFMDDIELILYSNVCGDIMKSYHSQEEIISRSLDKKGENNNMNDIIPTIQISKKKCCKKRTFTTGNVACQILRVNNDSEFGGWDWADEKSDPNATIYNINPDDLTEAKSKIVSDVIDQMAESDVWYSRAKIINNLVKNKHYVINTIRADLTRLQQSGKKTVLPRYGLNFRKIGETEELELLYLDEK
jgi:hypothetical protein